MTHVASTPLFDEARVKRALVHVLTADGKQTSGTGFFVGERDALSCFHVVSDIPGPIPVLLSDGNQATATVDPERSWPDADLAVLQIDQVAPEVLPCGTGADPQQAAWAIGYERPSHYLKGPVPTPAVIGGSVTVQSPQSPRHPPYTYGGFALSTAVIRPGISGGPLVDRTTGVTIGIVGVQQLERIEVRRDAFFIPGIQFNGYAIDFAYLAESHRPFAELIRSNRDQVPAYGRYLSPAGARVLCQRQRAETLAELRRSRYDPATYTPREIEQQINDFLASGFKLLPVVGNSGVGKTCLLSQLIENLPDRGRTVVAVRGFHVGLGPGKWLADDLEASLASLGQGLIAGLDRLFDAIHPDPLVVLFDAVNEIPYGDTNLLRSWWARTVEWVAGNNVRLILTSRERTWDLLRAEAGQELCYRLHESPPLRMPDRSPLPEKTGLTLGSFTPREFATALDRYGVQDPNWDLAKYPFFLRVWSRLAHERAAGSPEHSPSPLDLLGEYVLTIQQQISRATNGDVSAIQVDRILTDLGKDALATKANTIPAAVAEQRLAAPPAARRALIGENVLEEGQTHFRFAFDTLAEFFMARHIDLKVLTPDHLRKLRHYGQDSQGMAVGFAVLRAEHAGDKTTVEAVLREFVAQSDVDFDLVFAATARLLSHFHQPLPHFAHLQEAARRGAARALVWGSPIGAVGQLVRTRRVPARDVLELLRPTFVHDDPYRYEWGHWMDWTTRQFEADCGLPEQNQPAAALLLAFDEQPEDVMDMLIDWLADETPFEKLGYVTIGDVAAAILYHRRQGAFDRLCDRLAEQAVDQAMFVPVVDQAMVLLDRLLSDDQAMDLLDRLLSDEPDRAVGVLERWAGRCDERYDRVVIRLGHTMAPRGTEDPYAARRAAILDGLWQRTIRRNQAATEAYIRTVELLSLSPQHRNLAFNVIEQNLPRRWPEEFHPRMLIPYVADRGADVLRVLDRCIAANQPKLTRAAVGVLLEFRTNATLVPEAIHRLHPLVPIQDASLAYRVGRAIEEFLHFVPPAAAARDCVMQLAHQSVRVGHKTLRKCLLYYIGSGSRESQGLELQQINALLQTFLDAESDKECVEMLVDQFDERSPTFGELLETIRPVRSRLTTDDFERIVMRAIRYSQRRRNADYFTQWATFENPASIGPRFQVLLNATRTGKTPQEALELANMSSRPTARD